MRNYYKSIIGFFLFVILSAPAHARPPTTTLNITHAGSEQNTLPTKHVCIDLDQDMRTDVVPTIAHDQQLRVSRNLDNAFNLQQVITQLSGGQYYMPLLFGDVDNDNKPDIISSSAVGLEIFLNNSLPGSINFGSVIHVPFSGYIYYMSLIGFEDLDQDGDDDLIFEWLHSHYDTNIAVMLNSSSGFSSPIFSPTPSRLYSTHAFIDVNGDGLKDALLTDTEHLIIQINQGAGNFGPAQIINQANRSLLGAADFNRDGKVDLLVNSDIVDDFGVTILFGTGNGITFNPGNRISLFETAGRDDSFTVIDDLNSDGASDFVLAGSFYGSALRLYQNRGNGSFDLVQSLPDTNYYSHGLIGCELNADTKKDLILAGDGGLQLYRNASESLFRALNPL